MNEVGITFPTLVMNVPFIFFFFIFTSIVLILTDFVIYINNFYKQLLKILLI